MVDNVEPVVARTALSASHRQLEVDAGAALLNWVPNGFSTTDGGGLTANVAAGRAFLAGAIADRDVSSPLAMVDAATNRIFVYIDDILDDGVVYFHIDQDDTPPTEGPSHKIATVTTSGGSITLITDERRTVPELVGGLVLGGPLTAATVQSPAASALTLLGGNGTVIVDGLLRPEVDDTRDLGILAQRFRDVRLSRTLFIGDDAQLQQLTAGRLDLLTGVDFNVVLGDIILAAGRLVDGIDPSDHSGRHDAGGSDALVIDAAAGVGSPRTLGTGAAQAAQGSVFANHDARHEPGGADPMAVDEPAATGSLRTLGLGSEQAAQGSVFANHNARHEPGGADPMAVDAAVSVGSLRRLGTTSLRAAPGDHGHSVLSTKTIFKRPPDSTAYDVGAPTKATWFNWPIYQLSPSSEEGFRGSFEVPGDWDVGTALVFRVVLITTSAVSGNVLIELDINSKGDNENTGTGQAAHSVVVVMSSSSNIMHIDTIVSKAGSFFAAGDIVSFELRRDPVPASDTYPNDVGLAGLKVEYTAG